MIRRWTLCALIGASLGASLGACNGSSPPPHEAPVVAGASVTVEQLDALIDALERELGPRAERVAREASRATSLRNRLASGDIGIDTRPAFRDAIVTSYAERAYQPLFVAGDRLNAHGVALMETFVRAELHALDPADFHAGALAERLGLMRARDPVDTSALLVSLTRDERTVLASWLTSHVELANELPELATVVDLVTSRDAGNPLPRLGERFLALAEGDTSWAEAATDAELLLADAYLRWALEMRARNLAYVTADEAEERGWDLENHPMLDTYRETLAVELFREAIEHGTWADDLEELSPPFTQYDRLLEGARTYSEFVMQGGWQPLPGQGELRLGNERDAVVALRRRLHAEGYFDGDLSNRVFDEDLADAVRDYQRTHQLRITGIVDDETRTSLNVPAERRLAQIHVTLQRWRETRIGADHQRDYILVNLPDFHGELWDGDELIHRWRVIVGRLRRAREDDGSMRYWGATPLFSNTMRHIVVNPYWNVPLSIWRNEYQRHIEEDPNWMAANHFEYIQSTGGRQFLRQTPGPHNALGLVKFLFPNEHDVYLHDTNQPNLFGYDIRAFSYGCIRVQNALELAAILLARDQGVSESQTRGQINQLLARGTEQWIGLRNPLPIHLEYYAVRGDDDGRMHFLADVYRHDLPIVDELEATLATRYAERRAQRDALQREAEERLAAGRAELAGDPTPTAANGLPDNDAPTN